MPPVLSATLESPALHDGAFPPEAPGFSGSWRRLLEAQAEPFSPVHCPWHQQGMERGQLGSLQPPAPIRSHFLPVCELLLPFQWLL